MAEEVVQPDPRADREPRVDRRAERGSWQARYHADSRRRPCAALAPVLFPDVGERLERPPRASLVRHALRIAESAHRSPPVSPEEPRAGDGQRGAGSEGRQAGGASLSTSVRVARALRCVRCVRATWPASSLPGLSWVGAPMGRPLGGRRPDAGAPRLRRGRAACGGAPARAWTGEVACSTRSRTPRALPRTRRRASGPCPASRAPARGRRAPRARSPAAPTPP